MLTEAVGSALDFAEVCSFAVTGDVVGLLSSLRPDAVVVDSEAIATAAAAFAMENDVPMLRISVREDVLHVFQDGVWQDLASGDAPTPSTIRNVLAGALFSRGSPWQ